MPDLLRPMLGAVTFRLSSHQYATPQQQVLNCILTEVSQLYARSMTVHHSAADIKSGPRDERRASIQLNVRWSQSSHPLSSSTMAENEFDGVEPDGAGGFGGT